MPKPPNTSAHRKQIDAINLAVGALTRERRRLYAAGEHAYQRGIRTEQINGNGITGEGGSWAVDGHRNYTQYTQAIEELQDLIEILNDPGAKRTDQEQGDYRT